MFSVLIYEVTGPIFAKLAIQKAGEIDGSGMGKNKNKNKPKVTASNSQLDG